MRVFIFAKIRLAFVGKGLVHSRETFGPAFFLSSSPPSLFSVDAACQVSVSVHVINLHTSSVSVIKIYEKSRVAARVFK